MSAVDIRKIKQVDDLSEEAEFARDIWLFSFYCSGMNMTDICHLKQKQTLCTYRTISAFLDNDKAGENALEEIRSLGIETIDHSIYYNQYKDLNKFYTHDNM